MLFTGKDVMVLDLTHGGIPLARSIAKRANRVIAVDVYGTVDQQILDDLQKEGIEIGGPISHDIDIVVAPVHMDPALLPSCKSCEIITHHRATGELLAGTGARIVEITGTTAKTSTAVLLSDMVSRSRSVVSHTSRGVEHWEHGVARMLHQGLSITPASMLKALDYCTDIDPDLYIFEVSLGGTGAADLGIITSLANEYSIAGGHSTSTEAKMQMMDLARGGSILLVNGHSGIPPDDVRMFSFSTSSKDADFYLDDSHTGLWTIYCGNDQRIRFMPDNSYNAEAYSTAIVCATAAATLLQIEPAHIERTLKDFQGVHGRMRLVDWAGRTMVDNSNSGMNIRSARQALDFSKGLGENRRRILLLGEEARQVCEGLDPVMAGDFVSEHSGELDAIILVGERMRAISGDNVHHSDDINSALRMAEALTNENDIIISCVKCFR